MNNLYKIVFLDIDGVLNSDKFYRRRGEPDFKSEDEPPYPLSEFDPESVGLLNKIINETNASIVVSSSWRIGRSIEELKELFNSVGIEGEIIGKTPSSLPRSKYGETVRGDEIKLWLSIFEGSFNTENFKNKGTVNYVILDDDNDMLPEQRDNFFRTDFMLGLTEEKANLIIDFFKKDLNFNK